MQYKVLRTGIHRGGKKADKQKSWGAGLVVEAPANKSGDLTSVPGTDMIDGENQHPKVVSPLTSTCSALWNLYSHREEREEGGEGGEGEEKRNGPGRAKQENQNFKVILSYIKTMSQKYNII